MSFVPSRNLTTLYFAHNQIIKKKMTKKFGGSMIISTIFMKKKNEKITEKFNGSKMTSKN